MIKWNQGKKLGEKFAHVPMVGPTVMRSDGSCFCLTLKKNFVDESALMDYISKIEAEEARAKKEAEEAKKEAEDSKIKEWSWLVEEIKNKICAKLGYTVTSDWWLGGVRISVDSGRGFSHSAHADEIKTSEAFIDSMKRNQSWHVVSCRTDEKVFEKQADGRVKVICRGEKTHEDGSTVFEWHYFEDYSPHTKYDGIFD